MVGPTPAPRPSGSAQRHLRRLQHFLEQGRLVALTTTYAVVERPVSSAQELDHPLRAIGCLRCGALSWNPNDVESHFCSSCKVFHDDG